MNDDHRKYLEMIQGVINRLAGNSFSIKGWAIALIGLLAGFAAKDGDLRFASLVLFPALCFWGLDAYYLRQERLYRALFNDVAKDPSNVSYSMNVAPYAEKVGGLLGVAWSGTVRWLHLPILLFCLLCMYLASQGMHVRRL